MIGSCTVRRSRNGAVEVIQADQMIDITKELIAQGDGVGLKVDGDLVDIGDGQAIYKLLGPSPDFPGALRAARVGGSFNA